jgi:hypothetical protein
VGEAVPDWEQHAGKTAGSHGGAKAGT